MATIIINREGDQKISFPNIGLVQFNRESMQ